MFDEQRRGMIPVPNVRDYSYGCQDRIPQSVDGLGDQNSPSGLFPEFVSFFTVTAHNQKSLNDNTLYTLLTNRSIRIKQSKS